MGSTALLGVFTRTWVQQLLTEQVTDFGATIKQSHQHVGANGGRARGVTVVVDAHAAVVTDATLHLAALRTVDA